MSTASRDSTARLGVRVSSNRQPLIRRYCPRCAGERPFASSGKFRVNAQRKTIDAWLIFLCGECDWRWNLPIHERRPVRAIDPLELESLMRNDAALAARHAAAASTASSDVALSIAFLQPLDAGTKAIEIVLEVSAPCRVRLDRLLASLLGLRREEILALHDGAVLSLVPASPKALRRPAADGQQIHLDLLGCPPELGLRCRTRLADASLSIPAADRPD